MRDIDVNDLQDDLPQATACVTRALEHALQREDVAHCALSVAVVDDRRMRELNRRFTGHDSATDVLSFELDDDPAAPADGAATPLSGEIIVNAQRAIREAAKRGAEPEGELMLYAVHGLLHLLDYDDLTPAEARRMHAQEDELLTELGHDNAFSRPETS